jgi:hypothetical protein
MAGNTPKTEIDQDASSSLETLAISRPQELPASEVVKADLSAASFSFATSRAPEHKPNREVLKTARSSTSGVVEENRTETKSIVKPIFTKQGQTILDRLVSFIASRLKAIEAFFTRLVRRTPSKTKITRTEVKDELFSKPTVKKRRGFFRWIGR